MYDISSMITLCLFVVVVLLAWFANRFAKLRRLKKEFLEKFDIPINSSDARYKIRSKLAVAQKEVLLAFKKVNMEKVMEDLSQQNASFLDFIHCWNEQFVPVEIKLSKLHYLEFLANYFGFDEAIEKEQGNSKGEYPGKM